MKGVIKIKDRTTGKEDTAIYAYSTKHGKMLYHVDGKPLTDRKFDKQYKTVENDN